MPRSTAGWVENRIKPACKRLHSPPLSATAFPLMNPDFTDPNNHVPEVSPDDGWDDAKGFAASASTPVAILPQRRTAVERAAMMAVEEDSPGLRIEPNV